VDGRHHQALACPSLAHDQGRHVVRGQAADHLVDRDHGRCLAHECHRRKRGCRLGILGVRGHALSEQRFRDDGLQVVEVERFRQVVEGTGTDGVDRGLARAVGRHHDHVNVRETVADLLEGLQTVGARHADVHEDEAGLARGDRLHRLLCIAGHTHLVALVAEELLERGRDRLVVVDDEDLSHRRGLRPRPRAR
jgi:hypothetical protein